MENIDKINTDENDPKPRSYIIHLQQLTKIEVMEKDTHIALLKNGNKIPLSKTGYIKWREVLGL